MKISEDIIRKQSSALIFEKDKAVLADVIKNIVDAVVLRDEEGAFQIPREINSFPLKNLNA